MNDRIVTVKIRLPAHSDYEATRRAEAILKAGGCTGCRIVGVEPDGAARPIQPKDHTGHYWHD